MYILRGDHAALEAYSFSTECMPIAEVAIQTTDGRWQCPPCLHYSVVVEYTNKCTNTDKKPYLYTQVFLNVQKKTFPKCGLWIF